MIGWRKRAGAVLLAGGLVVGLGAVAGDATMTWDYETGPLVSYGKSKSKPQADRWGLFAMAANDALDAALAAQIE